jgi:hypothetical protein
MDMKLFTSAALAAIICISIVSCDQKGDARVTSDMITNSQTATGESIPTADITFEKDTFDFGTVIEGEKVVHAFTFTNTGKYDLIISKAVGSCGCTVPEWPKEPIRPGKTGAIDVVFDSDRRVGKAMKDVTIYANTEPATRKVVLSGFVKGDPSEE